MNPKKRTYKALMVVSLALFVTSIFLPWVAEHRRSTLGGRINSQFWSYQTIINVFYDTRRGYPLILRFQEYWFPSTEYAYPPNIYHGWFFVFVFQIIGIVTGAIGIFKENVKGKPLPLILTSTCLISSLILCGFQLLKQSAAGRSYIGSISAPYFDIGFSLAIISTMLWTVPLWIDKLLKRKILSLILLLIATAIPTVLFIIVLAAILLWYIQMGGGDFWFDWNRQLIGVTSQGAGIAMYIPNFILGLICIPLFFASILLLYKELRNRRARSLRETGFV